MSSDLFAIESERYLIGAALSGERTVFSHILDHIQSEDDFYRGAHRDAWRVIMDLYRDGKGIDLPIVTQQLPDDSRASASMLAEAFSSVAATDAATISTHALMVREKALARRVREIAGGAAHELQDGADVFDVLDTLQGGLLEAQRGEAGSSTTVSEMIPSIIEGLEAVDNAPDGVTGLPSGLRDLDRLTSGWQDGNLVVVAARPSMGKTSLALHQALKTASLGGTVGIFSLEMSSEELTKRLLMTESGVDGQRARMGRLSDADWSDVTKAGAELAEYSSIRIDDRGGLTPVQVRARAQEWAMHEDLDLIIVDYLQLMTPGVKTGTREQAVSYMSRSMKALAKDFDVPVLLLSQLNRAVERRDKKRPKLADLRASGAIEQDADVVTFIYRAERYGLDVDDEGRSTNGVAELDIAKQRNGPIGTVRVRFEKETGRWSNLSERDEPAHQGDGATDSAPF